MTTYPRGTSPVASACARGLFGWLPLVAVAIFGAATEAQVTRWRCYAVMRHHCDKDGLRTVRRMRSELAAARRATIMSQTAIYTEDR